MMRTIRSNGIVALPGAGSRCRRRTQQQQQQQQRRSCPHRRVHGCIDGVGATTFDLGKHDHDDRDQREVTNGQRDGALGVEFGRDGHDKMVITHNASDARSGRSSSDSPQWDRDRKVPPRRLETSVMFGEAGATGERRRDLAPVATDYLAGRDRVKFFDG